MGLTRVLIAALSVLVVVAAILIGRDEVKRPRYPYVSIQWLVDPLNARAVKGLLGQRITVSGDAGPTYGRVGAAYAIFSHYQGDHPWDFRCVYVMPQSNEPSATDHSPVVAHGILQTFAGDGNGNTLMVYDESPAWPMIVKIPLLAFAAVLAFLVMFAFVPSTRRLLVSTRPGVDHRCPCCGYDIRATPNRCPECGSLLNR